MLGTTDRDRGESKAILELWTTTLTDFNSINWVNDTISYLIRILQAVSFHSQEKIIITKHFGDGELKTKTEE